MTYLRHLAYLGSLVLSSASYAIPDNSHVIGNDWYCNTGYIKQSDHCKKLYVPPNARVLGSAWYCNTGFKRRGNQCNRLFVPKNARVLGSSWYCNNGFKRQRNQCNKVNPPKNARVLGSSWYCNTGFKRQGNTCTRVNAPEHAYVLGSSWFCNTGYKRQENQCVSLQQAGRLMPAEATTRQPVKSNGTRHSHGTREHSHLYPVKQGVQHQHGKNGLTGKAVNIQMPARVTTATPTLNIPTLKQPTAIAPMQSLVPTTPLIATMPLIPTATIIPKTSLMPTAPLIPITPSYSRPQRSYICSELSASEANSLYLAGHSYLDRDNDGLPCEPYPNPYVRPVTPTQSYESNCHYVNGYTRSNGSYVSGHTRCR